MCQEAIDLHVRLRSIAEATEPRELRDCASEIFSTFTRLLGYAGSTTPTVQLAKSAEAHAVFEMMRAEALASAELLDECCARPCVGEKLAGALELAGFAVRHEVGAVFGRVPAGLDGLDVAESRRRVAEAKEVLRACFEQCLVTLARVFDPALDCVTLFDDAAARRGESLRLCHDLISLLEATRRAEASPDASNIWLFGERLEYFRAERMRQLMLSDWQTFETFAEEWRGLEVDKEEAGRFLRRFGQYVKYLIDRVRMRSVLTTPRPAVVS